MSRRENNVLQDAFTLEFDHALTAITAADTLLKCRRPIRIDAIDYINVTGFVQHNANYWIIGIKIGTVVAGQWSTQDTAQGTIAANTHVDCVMTADTTDQAGDIDDVISLFTTVAAAAGNLPAGRVVVHCRYL